MDKSYFCLLVLLFPIIACLILYQRHRVHKRRLANYDAERNAILRQAVADHALIHPYYGNLPDATPRRPTPAHLRVSRRIAPADYFGPCNSTDRLLRSTTDLPAYSPMATPGSPVLPDYIELAPLAVPPRSLRAGQSGPRVAPRRTSAASDMSAASQAEAEAIVHEFFAPPQPAHIMRGTAASHLIRQQLSSRE